ncbi:MAG: hypothetical protein ACOY0T_06625 [Myxococcota bacterium]
MQRERLGAAIFGGALLTNFVEKNRNISRNFGCTVEKLWPGLKRLEAPDPR